MVCVCTHNVTTCMSKHAHKNCSHAKLIKIRQEWLAVVEQLSVAVSCHLLFWNCHCMYAININIEQIHVQVLHINNHMHTYVPEWYEFNILLWIMKSINADTSRIKKTNNMQFVCKG